MSLPQLNEAPTRRVPTPPADPREQAVAVRARMEELLKRLPPEPERNRES